MTPDELENARLAIERERLELDKAKAELDRGFLRRHSSVLIPAAVSLAAVIVSLGQVWVTKITKDKELEITTVHRRLELEVQDKQKERDRLTTDAQKKRELDLSVARFVTENRQAIFN